MDDELYMAMWLLLEDIEIPESTDESCEKMIREYIRKEKREKRTDK